MIRTALMTKHSALNYGAALQCLATQYLIEGLGARCEIIDYNTTRSKSGSKLLAPPVSAENILHDARNLVNFTNYLKRRRSFERFARSYYHMAPGSYDVKNIKTAAGRLDYDCYITGSDQTFNLNLERDEEEQKPYFWNFLHGVKKISYASSMGENLSGISEHQKKWLKKELLSYKALSVREFGAARFIKELTGITAPVLLDPTLMLSADEWKRYMVKADIKLKDYILFYTVLSSRSVIEFIKEVGLKTGLPVVAAHSANRYELFERGFARADSCGPGEFLSLVKNASLIVTTSFHGTAFAVNFEKPFISLCLLEGNRIKTLLKMTGLMDRAADTAKRPELSRLFEVDFTQCRAELSKKRAEGMDYLKRAVLSSEK